MRLLDYSFALVEIQPLLTLALKLTKEGQLSSRFNKYYTRTVMQYVSLPVTRIGLESLWLENSQRPEFRTS